MSEHIPIGKLSTNSPINNSTSKQTFSFGKSPRFSRKSSMGDMGSSMYNLPGVLSTRATSLGMGNRPEFSSRKNQAPYYNMPSMFDTKAKHQHVYTFGISREFYKKVIYII